MTLIQAFSWEGDKEQIELDVVPDSCPICHVRIVPKLHFAALKGVYFERELEVLFQCTNGKCRSLFIGAYYRRIGRSFGFSYSAPTKPMVREFSEEIEELSPNFVEIYSQCVAADAAGLTQLVGMGLRKALEYLVKDYAIWQFPESAGEIARTMLGDCIKKYVDDARVQACAKRAAWLGNDETHYVRRWENKDVVDLHTLIELTSNSIHNALLTERYIREMPE